MAVIRTLVVILALSSAMLCQTISIGGSVSVGGSLNFWEYVTAGTGCGAGYSFSREVLLLRSVGSDLTNYPYQFVMNYAPLAASGSGGEVQHSTTNSLSRTVPADVIWCDASSGGNQLKHEVVSWDSTTGATEFVLQRPTMHTASTDSAFLFIHKSSVSTDQEDLSLWTDINCKFIFHLPDGTTLDAKDSCGLNNGTITTIAATAGKIGGGAAFVNDAAKKITFGSGNLALTGSPFTISFWGKPNFSQSFPVGVSLQSNDSGDPWHLGFSTSSSYLGGFFGNSGGFARLKTNLTIHGLENVFHHLAATYNGSGAGTSGNYSALQDGLLQSLSAAGTFSSATNISQIGNTGNGNNQFEGPIDEVRGFSDVKSTDWLSTDWLTQVGANPAETDYSLSTYIVTEASYSVPTIRQKLGCGQYYFSGTCKMGFPFVSGNTLVIGAVYTDANCTAPTDSLGSTFTLIKSTHITGTIHSYSTCIYTAPISSASVDTISGPAATSFSYVIAEVIGITTSGVATDSSSVSPPAALSATSPGANSLLVCVTMDGYFPDPPTPPTTSEGYALFNSATTFGDHPSTAYFAYGVVGTGTKTCTLNYTGSNPPLGASMAIFAHP
jgi:hypothetical protein